MFTEQSRQSPSGVYRTVQTESTWCLHNSPKSTWCLHNSPDRVHLVFTEQSRQSPPGVYRTVQSLPGVYRTVQTESRCLQNSPKTESTWCLQSSPDRVHLVFTEQSRQSPPGVYRTVQTESTWCLHNSPDRVHLVFTVQRQSSIFFRKMWYSQNSLFIYQYSTSIN